MKEFTYKARNKDGSETHGAIEAENEQAAASLLISKKIFPVNIKEGKGGEIGRASCRERV